MTIDGVQQVVREIPAASAVPQVSLTRGDREQQMEEGRPPMEVALVDHEAVRFRKREELQDKWRRRQEKRQARRMETNVDSSDSAPAETLDCSSETLDKAMPETAELSEDGPIGTLFDVRS